MSDNVFEMTPLREPSHRADAATAAAGYDEVDSIPSVKVLARKTPQPFDPISRGRRAQTVR